MVKYIIVHNKHEGCYDFHYCEDKVTRTRMTSITINPPKLFLFNTRDQAQDFFEDYINDVDVTDIKCKKENDDIEHVENCTCGIIELDKEGNPILFYNKKNQIFLLENDSGPQVFVPPHDLKEDIKTFNLTNLIIQRCKTLGREQRNKYIELGKYCEECLFSDKRPFKCDDEEEEKNLILELKGEAVPESSQKQQASQSQASQSQTQASQSQTQASQSQTQASQSQAYSKPNITISVNPSTKEVKVVPSESTNVTLSAQQPGPKEKTKAPKAPRKTKASKTESSN